MGASRIAFNMFGVSVYWYGLLIACAAVLGLLVTSRREAQYELPRGSMIDCALFMFPAAIISARLYYVAFSLDEYVSDIFSVFSLRQGGIAIYGAIIGGILAMYAFTRVKKISFLSMADAAAPGLALGQAIGRWGNFFNQEAYGGVVTQGYLRFFPAAVYIDANVQWHYATFFYESVLCAGICAFLLLYSRKNRARGACLWWYMLIYGAGRALIEGLRTDSLMLGPMRVSQILSILVVLFAGAALCLNHKNREGR